MNDHMRAMELRKAQWVQQKMLRNAELARMDADDDGQWITTENGNHIHLNEAGEPDKGNPHVLLASKGVKVKKEGKLYIARASNGYAVCSGRDEKSVVGRAVELSEQEGPVFGMKKGESRTFSPKGVSYSTMYRIMKNADTGSTAKVKGKGTFTCTHKGEWELVSGNRKTVSSSDALVVSGNIEEVTYIK